MPVTAWLKADPPPASAPARETTRANAIGLVGRCARSALAGMATSAILGVAGGTAQAVDEYPARPVRLVVPNAPGSSIDTIARLLSVRLGESLGTSIVIENRAGASGVVGMEAIRTAPADGYTLGIASASSMSVAPAVQKSVPYDAVTDFGFVSLVAVLPSVLVVTQSLPVRTVRELVDYCRTHPGQVNMSSAGPGSASHLAGAQLALLAGFESVHVPYKGGGSEMSALVAGETHWAVTPAPAAMALVKGGRLRAIAQSLDHRTALLADLPGIAETVPGYDFNGWAGLVSPRGVSASVTERVRDALTRTLSVPAVREALAGQGAEVRANTPAEFRAFVQRNLADTIKVVKSLGLTPE
jgi:tripartite-type tricarboxylate transporter receptor subunit TctC